MLLSKNIQELLNLYRKVSYREKRFFSRSKHGGLCNKKKDKLTLLNIL